MKDNFPVLPDVLTRAKANRYQILPDLAPEEYAALKSDIEERGVMVPIEYDQDGNIIDGHHRHRACIELGIKDWPRIIRTYPDDAARLRQARKLNVVRRHLDNAAKRTLIEAGLKETPTQSDRAIAKEVGVSNKTVAAARRVLEAREEIPHAATRIDAKGRKQPAKKTLKQPPVTAKLATTNPLKSTALKKAATTQVSTLKSLWVDISNAALRAAWEGSNNKARRGFLQWLIKPDDQIVHTRKK